MRRKTKNSRRILMQSETRAFSARRGFGGLGAPERGRPATEMALTAIFSKTGPHGQKTKNSAPQALKRGVRDLFKNVGV